MIFGRRRSRWPRRNKKLIEPRLQMRLAALFLGVACGAVLVQALVLSHALQNLAGRLPNDGALLVEEAPQALTTSLFVSFLLLAPLTVSVGILAMFRIVGPLYRFRVFLRDVAAGKQREACRIRKHDELHDLCALLNEVTAPLRGEIEVESGWRVLPGGRAPGGPRERASN